MPTAVRKHEDTVCHIKRYFAIGHVFSTTTFAFKCSDCNALVNFDRGISVCAVHLWSFLDKKRGGTRPPLFSDGLGIYYFQAPDFTFW